MIHVIMPMGWFLMTPIGACVQCNIRRLLGKHPVSPPPSPPPSPRLPPKYKSTQKVMSIMFLSFILEGGIFLQHLKCLGILLQHLFSNTEIQN